MACLLPKASLTSVLTRRAPSSRQSYASARTLRYKGVAASNSSSNDTLNIIAAPISSHQGYGSAPPPQPGDHPLWVDELLPSFVPTPRQVFCNRALNMKHIKAIGFDMDYTLAQYRPETFEALAHQQTVEKLVTRFGYPEELRSFTFSWDYMMKGLVIDKNRGNMLKVDRHKYVKIGYHGFQALTSEERKTMYNSSFQSLNFEGNDYALVDTLFSLAEAYLFMQLVEFKDSPVGKALHEKSYHQLYKDLRSAVDMCHRDGSLKKSVAADPAKFIHHDPLLRKVLRTLRASGRRIFLATNSIWDYTNVVMNYLLLGERGSGRSVKWLDYFDVVMVGCGKPAFFNDRGQLFSVDVGTGLLRNTDEGMPITPIDEADVSEAPLPDLRPLSFSPAPSPNSSGSSLSSLDSMDGGASNGNGKPQRMKPSVFQGGCYKDLHRILGVTSGEQVLYAGDHIYGDIVKAKQAIGWRTLLVVPELDVELALQEQAKSVWAELRLLRTQRDSVDDQMQRFEWALAHSGWDPNSEAYAKNLAMLKETAARHDALRSKHSEVLSSLHRRHHPIWGQILKTGYQNSRFAHQIERYACLYTSHVSNLAYYSPNKRWQGRCDIMAHEDVDFPEAGWNVESDSDSY
uniref:5'-nucleotidase n=1 Tax=Dunaliella tertiolecta TaxID=3047 RepID=A0A7S3VHX6_DUNTE|mmetsp:Transcript_23953/g.65733  ORF Transcript_23953/g.65733 Transcript_23953/m.65733 type:complete len:629 (+) Transcript_23953:88-1974(+)